MATPTPRPGILEISPYKAGGAGAPDRGEIYKLASNESALGASPLAAEAYRNAAALHRYPDGGADVLRERIAALHGLDAARIVCGAGSDELLQLLARAYLGPGDNAVQTEYGFLVYALATKACGAEIRFAREKRMTADVDEILALADARTRIVFLANPNNPTGTYMPDAEVRRLRKALREDILLVIDAAYAEYMTAPDYDAGADLVDDGGNVVMTRTFSKIYGLAGLRLGWAYCPSATADVLNRIRGPFNVNAAALAAGAAAIADQDFVAKNREHNAAEYDWLTAQFERLGLDYQPSVCNFILVKFPQVEGLRAREIEQWLAANGVILRGMTPYGLGDWLRVTIGEREAHQRLIALLSEKFPLR